MACLAAILLLVVLFVIASLALPRRVIDALAGDAPTETEYRPTANWGTCRICGERMTYEEWSGNPDGKMSCGHDPIGNWLTDWERDYERSKGRG